MAKSKFSDWLHEVSVLAREDGIVDIEIDREIAKGYWRDGHSPKSFYNEHTMHAGISGDDDFDPARDL
jgi:hypothetical protein